MASSLFEYIINGYFNCTLHKHGVCFSRTVIQPRVLSQSSLFLAISKLLALLNKEQKNVISSYWHKNNLKKEDFIAPIHHVVNILALKNSIQYLCFSMAWVELVPVADTQLLILSIGPKLLNEHSLLSQEKAQKRCTRWGSNLKHYRIVLQHEQC